MAEKRQWKLNKAVTQNFERLVAICENWDLALVGGRTDLQTTPDKFTRNEYRTDKRIEFQAYSLNLPYSL